MTGAQSRKIHTEPEWAWSLADQADKLGIPVFMKEDLVPIIGDENMIQEMPEAFNKVLEAVSYTHLDVYKRQHLYHVLSLSAVPVQQFGVLFQ